MERQSWTIEELAGECGRTVRALRHFEDKGLLHGVGVAAVVSRRPGTDGGRRLTGSAADAGGRDATGGVVAIIHRRRYRGQPQGPDTVERAQRADNQPGLHLPLSIVIALAGLVSYDVPLSVFIAAVVLGLANSYRSRLGARRSDDSSTQPPDRGAGHQQRDHDVAG